MFKCERCGSGYSANHIGVENCPRCMLLDRVQAPLTFKMFKIRDEERTAPPIEMEPGRPEQREPLSH